MRFFRFPTATPEGKQPFYITSTSGPVLTIAGLWSEWRDRVDDETLTYGHFSAADVAAAIEGKGV